jgi:XXXCH domain-containing protein
MDNRLEKRLDRNALAEHLEELARQIRAGTFSSEQRSWAIPAEIDTRIRYKEKKGRFEARMRLRWPTIDGYDKEARKAVDDWRDSFKAVKHRMNRSFRKVALAVKENALPEPVDFEEFYESSKAFLGFSDPDLDENQKEFLDHLENLKQAVTDHRLNVVDHEVRDLRNCMRKCHREFR